MHLTAVADRLLLLEGTGRQALVSIGAQGLAVAAEPPGSAVVIATVDPEHRIDGALLLTDTGAEAHASIWLDWGLAHEGFPVSMGPVFEAAGEPS
jgi:hypothetical protein